MGYQKADERRGVGRNMGNKIFEGVLLTQYDIRLRNSL
jgi:hypothetical protein